MQNYLVTTCEILLVVVMPLLVLYLKGNWPLRKEMTIAFRDRQENWLMDGWTDG